MSITPDELTQSEKTAIHEIMVRQSKTYYQAYEIVKKNKPRPIGGLKRRISGEIKVMRFALGLNRVIFKSNN